jgi:hypothetical protein
LDPRRISRHSAVAGTAIWILWQLLAAPHVLAVLFVLSPLVLVPLLLSALVDKEPASKLTRAMIWAQLACALPLPLATSMGPSVLAALACLPWLGWTALAAVEAVRRLVLRLRAGGVRAALASELAVIAALGFPFVGSLWLIVDRLGLEPLGFSPMIVMLTAIHFHHAGLTLPACAGFLGRWRPEQRTWQVSAVLVVVAVPLVAIGITASPLLELIGALLTALAAAVVGVGMLLRARSLAGIAAALSALAGSCLLAAMIFAASYALGEYTELPWPDINRMVQLHGAVNALGFGLLGAWSWQLAPPPPPSSRDTEAAQPEADDDQSGEPAASSG